VRNSCEQDAKDTTNFGPEFDFRVLGDGRSASARYANNSNYRNDSLIRKESMESPMPDLVCC
jgi:hypothetical protein